MERFIQVACLITTLFVVSYAQSDWNKYPLRTITDIVREEEGEVSRKADLVVSADPFPSKTIVTYTGKHRPVSEQGKYFIGLWAESRNLPPENAGMLVEEYVFREKGKEYWMLVHKQLSPHLEKELKEGDEITIYYFFLGGYNTKTLLEKKIDKTKEDSALAQTLQDRIEWVFAVEEFQKPSLKPQAESEGTSYISQPLSAAIDRSLELSAKKVDVLIDPRQVKSKSSVTYTGDVRQVGEKKLRFLQNWLENHGLPPQIINLLKQEARFREGDKDYWLPVRKKILDDITSQMKKGDSLVVHTILAGGVRHENSLEWIFVVGEFSK